MTSSEHARVFHTRRFRRFAASVLLLLLALALAPLAHAACAASGAPWPQFHHDAAHTGCSPFAAAADTGALKWTFHLAQYTLGSPVVAGDGVVYIAAGSLYAISPAGAQKWAYSLGGGTFDYSTVTPALGPDGSIYFGAYTGDFYALTAAGALRWKLPMNASLFDTGATVAAGTVFVGDDLAHGGGLLALNSAASTLWQAPLDGDVYSGAAIFEGTAFITMNTTVANAKAGLYEFAAATGAPLRLYQDRNLAMFNFTPAVDPTGAVYVIDLGGDLLKFNQHPGSLAWTIPIVDAPGPYQDFWASPAIAPDGSIVVASLDGNLYDVSPAGALNWVTPLAALSHSSPAISADGMIFVGTESGVLYAIKPDGSVKWTFTADSAIESAPALAANGAVYFATARGTLYAVH